MACIPSFIRSKDFQSAMEAQTRGTSFSIYSRYVNITVWKDGGLVFMANNDFAGGDERFIAAKVNDKKNKEYHGICLVIIYDLLCSQYFF